MNRLILSHRGQAGGTNIATGSRTNAVWTIVVLLVLTFLSLEHDVSLVSAHSLDGAVALVAQHSGKCMAVSGNSGAAGALVVQSTCNGQLNQRMYVVDIGSGYHELIFANSNMCLDVPGGSSTWGVQLEQWPCNGGLNQQFTGAFTIGTVAFHAIVNDLLYFDVYGASTADGAAIVQWGYNGGTNQQWNTKTTYQGTFTGYAMGNLTGAGGVTLNQGHFANHSSTACGGGDPAGQWSFGTHITSVYSQGAFHNGTSGGTFYQSGFTLEDTGDPSCLLGNYWADLYFGRYKLSTDLCNCPGSPPGTCYNGVVNQCTDAVNYGSHPSTIYYRP
jgi:hypothetical protein